MDLSHVPVEDDIDRQGDARRPRNPRIPGPPRPDLAGKIAGIFPIPIGPGSGKYSGFCPDPDLVGIPGFGKSGIPVWSGSRDSGNRESRFCRDRENPPRCPGIGDFGVWMRAMGASACQAVPATTLPGQWATWAPAAACQCALRLAPPCRSGRQWARAIRVLRSCFAHTPAH